MSLLFILFQHLPHLPVQILIAPGQPLLQVLVYGGFGNAKMKCGDPHGGTGFNDVHSQCAGSLLKMIGQLPPSDAVCWAILCAGGQGYA